MATSLDVATSTRFAPSTVGTRSDPLDFFRGLAFAIPIGLLLWAGIIRVCSWMW